jgi:DNA repair exonuclease SbcCD ATPase subunit
LELEIASNNNAQALGLKDWEIKFSTERESKNGNMSAAFSVSLFPPGREEPIVWESYSGGESQRWQLATTLGLSEVLLSRSGLEPDIEFFDEPTEHLSDNGIYDLLECLKERARSLQRRIYMIDHRALDKGDFDGIITLVKDNNGVRIEGS